MCAHSSMLYGMGWLRLVGSFKLLVSFAKEPYKRDDILQKRPRISRSLLIVATPYLYIHTCIPHVYIPTYICTHPHTCTRYGYIYIYIVYVYVCIYIYKCVGMGVGV